MKGSLREMYKILLLLFALTALFIPSMSLGAAAPCTPPGELSDTFLITSKTVSAINFDSPSGPANNPSAGVWTTAPETLVDLSYKVAATVNNMATGKDVFCDPIQKRILSVKSIHDGGKILFKISWADPNASTSISDLPRFHDALAIAIPYPESLYPGCKPGITQPEMVHMGTPCNGAGGLPCCPMHIMFWRADKVEVENIVSNSPGTTHETPETNMGLFHTFQKWEANTWTIIVGRVLIGPADTSGSPFPGGNLVDLVAGTTCPIVFANWDGGHKERNGLKYISTWGNLAITP